MNRSALGFLIILITLCLNGCIIQTGGGNSGGNPSSPVMRNRWGLVRFGNEPFSARSFGNQPSLNMTQSYNGEGYTGCRPVRFKYNAGTASPTITFRDIQFANYEPCREGSVEDRYISTLKRANRYRVESDRLILLHNSQELAVFTAL